MSLKALHLLRAICNNMYVHATTPELPKFENGAKNCDNKSVKLNNPVIFIFETHGEKDDNIVFRAISCNILIIPIDVYR